MSAGQCLCWETFRPQLHCVLMDISAPYRAYAPEIFRRAIIALSRRHFGRSIHQLVVDISACHQFLVSQTFRPRRSPALTDISASATSRFCRHFGPSISLFHRHFGAATQAVALGLAGRARPGKPRTPPPRHVVEPALKGTIY